MNLWLTCPVTMPILNGALSWWTWNLPARRACSTKGVGTIDKSPIVRFTATSVAWPAVTPPLSTRIVPLAWAIYGHTEWVRRRHLSTQWAVWHGGSLTHVLLHSGTAVLTFTWWQPRGTVGCILSEGASPIDNCTFTRRGRGGGDTWNERDEGELVLLLRSATRLVAGTPGSLGEGEIMCSFTTNINQAGKQLSLESFCDAEKAQKPSPVISITRDNKCKGRQ